MSRLTIVALLVGLLIGLRSEACAQGGIPLWTNRYHGPSTGENAATDIAVDSKGNVFVTGLSVGGSNFDYATVGYSDGGVPLWTNRYPAQANYMLQPRIALDSNGNVFVTGISPSPGASNSIDFVTVGYSGAGGPLWTNCYPAQANPQKSHPRIAVDGNGNVFIAGPALSLNSNLEYAVVAYANAGTPLWTNRYHGSGPGNDLAWGIAVDASGNDVLVTGFSDAGGSATLAYSNDGTPLWTNYFNGSCLSVAAGPTGSILVAGYSPVGNNNTIYATLAYSNSGQALWINTYAGAANNFNIPVAIVADGQGNVFVTGEAYAGGWVYGTVAYSAGGVALWTNLYSGPARNDVPNAIALDGAGNVFVTGHASGSTGLPIWGTLAYSATGVPLWTNRYQEVINGFGSGSAVALDSAGNVFVTGNSQGTDGDNDFATIKYSTSLRPYLAIQKADNQAVLTWTNAGFLLQSAPVIAGSFTNIPGAASPFTNSGAALEQYFKLAAP